ncbi:MAG: hypothetical protein IPJ97_17020 [Proteobacteria bacterium]|nr:hypothetical protein [Pseudomonadota bacterium]
MNREIHRQEGEIVGDVDEAQSGIEFETVEGRERPLPAHHVAAVQVTVTFTDSAVPPALLHQRPAGFEQSLRLAAQPR